MGKMGSTATADGSDSNAPRVTSLRLKLQEKPQSAKLRAQLSCLLSECAKLQYDEGKRFAMKEEALSLAHKAIELAPDRPAGYGALANIALEHRMRMEALATAIELETKQRGNNPPTVGMALAFARLLTEPREEEARILTELVKKGGKGIGKASAKHPNRRDLSESENELYKQIQKTTDAAVVEPSVNGTKENETLGWIEYRLGSFFRKLQPEATYRAQSARHFRKAVEILPSNHILSKKSGFWLATLGTDAAYAATVDRCPEEYIVGLYSGFAKDFDNLLVRKLHYETPALLRRLVDGVLPASRRGKSWARRAADLGCGTGLSGVAFRSCVKNMTGVDLSPEMVEKAKERQCYESLVVGDVETVLNRSNGEETKSESSHASTRMYDLVFACDVFVYIGDLCSIFASVRNSLISPDGLFSFSAECLDEDQAVGNGFVLQKCARFAHKLSYIEELANKFGFEIRATKRCAIRKNEGKDVAGILAVMGVSK